MIATGLCLMGGCFAQESDSHAVETYWPAHAVTLSQTVVFKDNSDDLVLPFWTEGVRAGGRLENVHKGNSSQYNILCWGRWETVGGIRVADAMYLGLGTESSSNPEMSSNLVGAYTVCGFGSLNEIQALHGLVDKTSFAPYLEVNVSNDKIMVQTYLGDITGQPKQYPSPFNGYPWQIRAKCPVEGVPFDVVSYWWINDVVQKQFFVVQPMCAASGAAAFFTHGFNILTEI